MYLAALDQDGRKELMKLIKVTLALALMLTFRTHFRFHSVARIGPIDQ